MRSRNSRLRHVGASGPAPENTGPGLTATPPTLSEGCCPERRWQPAVADDWPDRLPVTTAEIDLLEVHCLDIVAGMLEHDGG